jgi:hypothetical protein
MEILGLKGSDIVKGGRNLKIHLETDDKPLVVDIKVSLLEVLLSQLAAAAEKAHEMRDGKTSPLFMEPGAYIVRASRTRRAITVVFRMSNGLSHNLIFSVPDAEHLQTCFREELDRLRQS